VILASEAFIGEHIHNYLRQTGPCLSPFNAWTLLKSLETMPVRIAAQVRSAGQIADYLADHPYVARVLYPGRPDHPQAALVKKQMFGRRHASSPSMSRAARRARSKWPMRFPSLAISNNLGDAKSLLTHPATTTHQRLNPEARADLGIGEGMVRLSVGLEDVDDLIEDLGAALDILGIEARRAAE